MSVAGWKACTQCACTLLATLTYQCVTLWIQRCVVFPSFPSRHPPHTHTPPSVKCVFIFYFFNRNCLIRTVMRTPMSKSIGPWICEHNEQCLNTVHNIDTHWEWTLTRNKSISLLVIVRGVSVAFLAKQVSQFELSRHWSLKVPQLLVLLNTNSSTVLSSVLKIALDRFHFIGP